MQLVTSPALEMWAGIECTINRVGDSYRDQLCTAGHYTRESDIGQLVNLGVRSIRYPVLWERHSADPTAWHFTDRVLGQLRDASIEPIIGLMHHGSGVTNSSLLDKAYPAQLAEFASVVARRYPWVRRYTPVNEPLTTARFATLYGLWYPHHTSNISFVSALLNQVMAIQQSMIAIRSVTPDAILVATEDLGFTHAVEALQYQASFENDRRWLTWDLLLGRVHHSHPLRRFLTDNGGAQQLHDITSQAGKECASTMLIGINHYLTSERFLDAALDRYPSGTHGGNDQQAYADVEAVRVLHDGPLGVREILRQAWERYRVPIAITEAHLGCTREQQMQWLGEVWQAARVVRSEGADVRAVTAWAAFGSFDWNSLLTRNDRVYEPGLYDLRSATPRATALATMVSSLSSTSSFDHPALLATPWWRDNSRLHYASSTAVADLERLDATPAASMTSTLQSRFTNRPLLVTGASGTLGHAITRIAQQRGLPQRGLSRDELDITDRAHIETWLDTLKPWAVVNAASWVRVDEAERNPHACVRTNADAAQSLAQACAARDIRFVNFSSDLVFPGHGDEPLVESDSTAPVNVYGRSRDEGERLVRLSAPDAIVVRTGAIFGDWDCYNFINRAMATLRTGRRVHAPSDTVVSATYLSDLVHAVLDLLLDGENGTWHLANPGALSWTDLARLAADVAGFDAQKVEECRGVDIGWTAPRPRYSALASDRASIMPKLEDALSRWATARPWERIL